MRTKSLWLCLLAFTVVALATVPASGDPIVSDGDVAVGDKYAVTTISGEASAWVDGSWTVSPADLQLVVQVTRASQRSVIFRMVSGTIQFDGKIYSIVASGWRGVYDREANTGVYQGPAVAPAGQRAFFIIYAHDTFHVQQGTYAHMWSDFRDEDRMLWRINLRTYRFKIN